MARTETKKDGFWDTLKTVFWALLIAMVFRSTLYQPFSIPSGSMKPTLLVGDYLFVSKFAYGYSHYSLPFAPDWFEGRIWAEMSTTDEAEVKRLGALVQAKGALAVDCPVSGGCHRADTVNISIFAGCDRETFERILPFLKTMGRRVLHTGDLGSASVLKAVTNYLATANLITCCEALVTAKAAGMDLNTTYEAIKISSGTSFVHETESQVILNGSRDISFTMDLVKKDVGLFKEVADRANVPLEIAPMLVDIFDDGIARYGERELSPNIIKRLEEATGLDIRAPGFPPEMTDDEPEEPGYEVVPLARVISPT